MYFTWVAAGSKCVMQSGSLYRHLQSAAQLENLMTFYPSLLRDKCNDTLCSQFSAECDIQFFSVWLSLITFPFQRRGWQNNLQPLEGSKENPTLCGETLFLWNHRLSHSKSLKVKHGSKNELGLQRGTSVKDRVLMLKGDTDMRVNPALCSDSEGK